jgi:hypothetical protein
MPIADYPTLRQEATDPIRGYITPENVADAIDQRTEQHEAALAHIERIVTSPNGFAVELTGGAVIAVDLTQPIHDIAGVGAVTTQLGASLPGLPTHPGFDGTVLTARAGQVVWERPPGFDDTQLRADFAAADLALDAAIHTWVQNNLASETTARNVAIQHAIDAERTDRLRTTAAVSTNGAAATAQLENRITALESALDTRVTHLESLPHIPTGGNRGDVLTIGATGPEWEAPHGGGGGTGARMVTLTAAAYAALPQKDPNTLYLVT